MTLIDAGVRPETDDLSACQMQVRKRNGSFEPVDVNKIVRAVTRCCEGLDGVDPMRVATRTIGGLCDGATTARARSSSRSRPPRRSSPRSRSTPGSPRGCWPTVHRQGGAQPGHPLLLPVRRASAHRLGLVGETTAEFVAAQRPQAQRRHRSSSATGCSSTSACARSTTATCCATPRRRQVIETPQYFFLRVACGLSASPRGGHRALYTLMSALEYMPVQPDAVQLRAPRHRRCRRATCSTRPPTSSSRSTTRYTDVAQLSKFAGGIGLAFHRVRSAGLADPGDERALERHRAVAEDARRLGRRGQPGGQAQGRVLRLPRDAGTPTSRSSWSCATTPATRPAGPATSTSPTGSPTCSWSGSSTTGVVAVRPEGGPASVRPLRRGVRAGLPRGRGPKGSTSAKYRPASSTPG